MRACVRVFVRARACVRVCVWVCVQPYAEILGFVDATAGEPTSTSFLQEKRPSADQKTPAAAHPPGFLPPGATLSGSQVWLVWRVGGAFWIDDLAVECAVSEASVNLLRQKKKEASEASGTGNAWMGVGKGGGGGPGGCGVGGGR